jgi:putative transposase
MVHLIGHEPNHSFPGRIRASRSIPYLLRDRLATAPNEVWSTDITYVPMAKGFLYLAAVLDWHSRYVLSCHSGW